MPGCGTMSNLDGKPQTVWSGPPTSVPSPFGGVVNDCKTIEASAGTALGWIEIPVLVCDLPISLGGDVLTLPRVLAMRQEWEQAKQTGLWPDWAWPFLQAEAAAASRIPP
jgi:hypothetical protein